MSCDLGRGMGLSDCQNQRPTGRDREEINIWAPHLSLSPFKSLPVLARGQTQQKARQRGSLGEAIYRNQPLEPQSRTANKS